MPAAPKQKLVIVDPDSDFLEWAARHLEAPSLDIVKVSDAEAALKEFLEGDSDLLLADLRLKPFDGLELLKKVRQNRPNAVVVLNGSVTSTNAVIEAMRLGAFDFLRKESLSFELRPVVENALQAAEQMKLVADEEPGRQPEDSNTDLIIGRSPAMQDVFKLIGRVARADAPVLITGESGTGKEVVANAIHKFSRRSGAGEYLAINCAAIPGNLLESELFGHEKGAFTGAVGQRIGRFEQCDGGTLFLDEIGDMPAEVQSKLLRVLQSGEFSRVGGNQTLTSSVRILAATNKHLEAEVESGRFREDLFYRLNVVRIHIPPLRQRQEDIRLLAEHFLNRQSDRGHVRRRQFSEEAIDLLVNHDWPGNVRELENTIERACVLATGNVLLPQDLPLGNAPRTRAQKREIESKSPGKDNLAAAAAAFLSAAGPESGLNPVELAERELIRAALKSADGDQAAVAAQLGFTKPALKKKLDRFEMEPD